PARSGARRIPAGARSFGRRRLGGGAQQLESSLRREHLGALLGRGLAARDLLFTEDDRRGERPLVRRPLGGDQQVARLAEFVGLRIVQEPALGIARRLLGAGIRRIRR